MLRSPVLIAAITWIVVACGPATQRTPDSARAPAGGSTRPDSTWPTIAWEPYVVPVADYGRGVIGIGAGPDPVPRSGVLTFRRDPDAGSPIAAVLSIRTDTSNGTQHYAVTGPRLRLPNLVEVGYEQAGVPVDSATSDGRWVRGLAGTDSAGRWIVGWADVRTPGVEQLWWADHLRSQSLFALGSTDVRLADTPDGARVPPPRGEYAMYGADSVRGRWLRVRVVSPSDYCDANADSTRRVERRLWVQYLEADGRPLVWYYTRGC
jgi:hypothetical protein